MRAEIKSITSPDIDIKSFYPEQETCFAFLLQIVVGVKGEKQGDTFAIEVCTPQWLLENNNSHDIVFGRHKLIVLEYNIERIIKHISKYCDSCERDTWIEIANAVSRIAKWEYEDYQAIVIK